MLRFLLILLLSALLPLAQAAKPSSEWIVDSDLGPDDALALLYLLKQPQVRIKALTLEMTGALTCAQARERAEALLRLRDQTSIPVACGRNQPLGGKHRLPALVKADNPGQSDIHRENAKDLIRQKLVKSNGQMNILAIGPLTNLAEVFEEHPALKKKVRMIYMMGGAIRVPGNVREALKDSLNRSAELNFYLDPLSTKKIFQSGVALTLFPLDVTPNDLWDPITAVIALNEHLAHFETLLVTVKQGPDIFSGTTVLDSTRGTRIRVCKHINTRAAKKKLFSQI